MAARTMAIVRAMRAVAAVGNAIVIGACVCVFVVPIYAAVVGTLACAVVASAALFGAYCGFDDRLRCDPEL